MILYLAQPALTNLSRRDRSCGWYRIALDRLSRKELRERMSRLVGRGITKVFSADIHSASAEIAADILCIPAQSLFELRPFNVGKLHGQPLPLVDSRLNEMLPRWRKNPDIPLRGGDSWTSFEHRFLRRVRELAKGDDALLLTDSRGIASVRTPEPSSLLVTLDPSKLFKKEYLIERAATSL